MPTYCEPCPVKSMATLLLAFAAWGSSFSAVWSATWPFVPPKPNDETDAVVIFSTK